MIIGFILHRVRLQCKFNYAICIEGHLRTSHGWEPCLASDPPTTLKERSRIPPALPDPHFASGYEVTEQRFVINL